MDVTFCFLVNSQCFKLHCTPALLFQFKCKLTSIISPFTTFIFFLRVDVYKGNAISGNMRAAAN